MLESAYYAKNRCIHDDYGYPEDYLVIGDSGGFQIQSFGKKGKNIKIEPLEILRWLESNVNIGMNLDIPPWTNFERSLRQSVTNFELFERERQNYDMKLYNILHGRTLTDATHWYESVKRFDFDGWAVGIKPSRDHLMQLTGYLLLRDADAPNLDNLHFFGMSDIKNSIMLALLSKKFNTNITYDSSTWTMGARFREFYYQYGTRNRARLTRHNFRVLSGVPCDCPVCSHITPVDLDPSSILSGHLMSLHNLYVYKEMDRRINIWVDDRDMLLEYSKYLGEYEFTVLMYEILDAYDSHDATWIYKRYYNHPLFMKWKSGLKDQKTQSSLFSGW